MTAPDPKVDAFIDRATQWRDEMKALRNILLDCDFTEELKWGKPCYTARGANIVIMQPFKAHLSLMFFKGALLKDREGILRSQGENTQSALRMEFTRPEDVTERATALRAYVEEAVAVEEAGLEIPKREVSAYEMPAELEKRLSEDEAYRRAFEALTPGRKKGYLSTSPGLNSRRRASGGSRGAGRRSWKGRATTSGEAKVSGIAGADFTAFAWLNWRR